MAERKNGAGSHLSGVLERSTSPRPAAAATSGPDADGASVEGDPPTDRGRGGGRPRADDRGPASSARARKNVKGRTIYLHDDLFERVLVQAHRRDKTISEYVASVLEARVPDHRIVRAPAGPTPDASEGRGGDAD